MIDKDTLVIVISQSGETADTLAALRACNPMATRLASDAPIARISSARAGAVAAR